MGTRDPVADKYPRKFGKYHLLSPLAQGGMGALYLGVTGDRGLERMMVIKTILPHLADAEYIARFRDEAKVVVRLSHGNLIPVFDAGQVEGELFLAMDFVEGRDLRAVWNRCAKKQVAFPVDVAVYIVKELCRGLAYAHAFPDLGLVHRDISPPNVLVSFTGEVKLTDFGLASSTLKLEKTAPGIIYGKVAYMSPEQARGEKLDGRSDQYAIGIVLWELLTGRQLFPPGKDQPADLLSRAKNPEILRPSKRAPRVPADLDDICLRALHPERDQRYPSCEEFRMDLQSWLAKHAATTDSGRISTFLGELFSEDMVTDRAERESMMSSLRKRAMTMPPTDELRQMFERTGQVATGEGGSPVRTPGVAGRRAIDGGDGTSDRRQAADRRSAARIATPPPIPRATQAGNLSAALKAEPEPQIFEEQEPNFVGQIVDGRYRVMELIGEGGMGKVYLAEHVEIGRRVAIKVLHPSYGRMPDLVERFRREARAASKIGHPHIVDVTDSGTTAEGAVYFVMEYLEGVELGGVIEREGAIDIGRALRVATQMSRALAAAHASGIIHRDLKPENVFLVTREGNSDFVKVLDFGIAKTTEAEQARERRLTSPGMAMGTPEYMAPEQAAGRPADARSDIYSLGAILYEMLTGVAPYQGENFMEILTKKATVDAIPPQALRGGIPEAVSQLVMQAMSREPDLRPQTMEALEYELVKCVAGRGAAVAQMLGMTTDPNVVAGLNPGMSMRNLDEGVLGRGGSAAQIIIPAAQAMQTPVAYAGGLQTPVRAQTSPVSSVTPVAGISSGLASTSGSGHGLAAVDRTAPGAAAVGSSPSWPSLNLPPTGSDRAAADAAGNDAARGEALGDVQLRTGSVLGWIILAALLLGVVGTVLYIAAGERSGRRQQPVAPPATTAPAPAPETGLTPPAPSNDDAIPAPVPKSAVDLSPTGSAATATPAGSGASGTGAAQVGVGVVGASNPDKVVTAPPSGSGSGGSATKPKEVATVSPKLTREPARNATEAQKFLETANAAYGGADYDKASEFYGRVAASPYKTARGLIGQARVAFQTKGYAAAVKLTNKAIDEGGGSEARLVKAQALVKLGRHEDAIKEFESVLTKKTAFDAEARAGLVEAKSKCGKACQ